jgi:hypothetical protein
VLWADSSDEAPVTNPTDKTKRVIRQYTDEDRYIALAAVDLNGGNVYRTAVALDMPAKTLDDWVKARLKRMEERSVEFAKGRNEKRGDLAAKLEDVAHTIVEAMPGKVAKATLSQSAVALGITIDKVRLLRGQGLEPDPATELCKLLGIKRAQLPDRLELAPGEELPSGFAFTGPVIDVQAEPVPAGKPGHPLQRADGDTTEGDSQLLVSLDDRDESAY